MHYEVLVEDKSGSIALDIALAKILGPNHSRHSWRVRPYKGLGRIPENLDAAANPDAAAVARSTSQAAARLREEP